MICDPCKTAGRMNKWDVSHMVKVPQPPGYADVYITYGEPQEMHALCEAKTTCPCQHRVGKHVKP